MLGNNCATRKPALSSSRLAVEPGGDPRADEGIHRVPLPTFPVPQMNQQLTLDQLIENADASLKKVHESFSKKLTQLNTEQTSLEEALSLVQQNADEEWWDTALESVRKLCLTRQ